jgi:NADH-quinone oxidoreductase subunit J
MTVTSRSAVGGALWLIFAFLNAAGLFALLAAPLLAVLQILVYAGAIMVLFLFVIMLLNLGNDFEPDIRGLGWKISAGGAALLILAFLARAVTVDVPRNLGSVAGPEALATAQAQYGVVGLIGIPLYNDYVVPLQATAILLLVAVVGAVVLAKRKV